MSGWQGPKRRWVGEGNGTPLQYSCLENPMDGGTWKAAVHGVAKSRTQLSDFTFTFHFHALEKEIATHSSVLAWRIPGMVEPGGLPSMGSHRVGHNWSDLTAAKRRWIRKEVGIAMKGQQEGSLWWWKSFLSWLYQCHYPAGDIVPYFCKIFPLGETG